MSGRSPLPVERHPFERSLGEYPQEWTFDPLPLRDAPERASNVIPFTFRKAMP